MRAVKFAVDIAEQKVLVIKDRYRLTARGEKRPQELKVSVSAQDVSPLSMNETAKTLVFEDESQYGFEAIEGLFEKDIVRFADKNGEIHTGEVIYDRVNGLHCLRTSGGKKYALYTASDRLVLGSALLGDSPEMFEEEAPETADVKVTDAAEPAPAQRNEQNKRGYKIYTDGSCLDNPGVCGAAFVAIDGSGTPVEERQIPIGYGTNNVAELTAMSAALKFALDECEPGALTLYSDSQYLIRGLTQWSAGWARNGWLKSSGEPVKNVELWRELVALKERAQEKFSLRFDWIKGHDGNYWNEVADGLAVNAAEEAAKQIA